MTKRDRQIIAYYRRGHSLRATGDHFGLCHNTIYPLLRRKAPTVIRRPGRPSKQKEARA